MKTPPTHSPAFRKDLEVVPRALDGGVLRYLVQDPLSDEVFELGEEEWLLCQQMDGETPLSDILTDFRSRTGIQLERKQLEAFGRRLESLGLLSPGQPTPAPLNSSHREIHLGNPDKALGFLEACFGWCFSPPFTVLWALLILLGLATFVASARELVFQFNLAYTFSGPAAVLTVMALGWLVVSPLGVIAQGIACKHYGGQVPESNAVLAFGIFPRFYFDIRDALWFLDKKARIRIFSAGLFFQLLLLSVCIIAWDCSGGGTAVHEFLFLGIAALVIFFLLNLLPVFERDGYLLLSTWVDIPHLHTRAKNWIKARFLLKPPPEPLSRRETLIFNRYGFLTYALEIPLWCFVLWQLGNRLTDSLEGVGACLFLIFLVLRFEDPIRRFFMRRPFQRKSAATESGGVKLRFLFRLSLLVLFIVLMFVPYPFEAGGDVTLLPAYEQGIRSQVNGEIETVHVREGEWVKAGQPLARLLGRDQRKRVEQVQAAIDGAEARKRMYAGGPKPEEIAKAEQEVKAAAKSLEYSNSQAARAERMFKNNAMSAKDYENALKFRDMDRDRLELAKKNLELVESGFRAEQVEAVEAEIRLLEVDLAHAKRDLELIELVSPIEGRVITPRIRDKEGQYLNKGELFAVVEDARTLIAEIEVPEKEAGEIEIGSRVRIRTWAYPNTVFETRVSRIAPVAYDKSKGKIERSYSDREWLIEQEETLKEKGKVIRVLCELDNPEGLLKTEMTGYAKIETEKRPVGIAFTRWLMRFLFVEVWSWIP